MSYALAMYKTKVPVITTHVVADRTRGHTDTKSEEEIGRTHDLQYGGIPYGNLYGSTVGTVPYAKYCSESIKLS